MRLKKLGIDKDVKHIYLDQQEFSNIFNTIRNLKPDEVYNLGAQSFVGASFNQPILTAEIDAPGAHRILEAIKTKRLSFILEVLMEYQNFMLTGLLRTIENLLEYLAAPESFIIMNHL